MFDRLREQLGINPDDYRLVVQKYGSKTKLVCLRPKREPYSAPSVYVVNSNAEFVAFSVDTIIQVINSESSAATNADQQMRVVNEYLQAMTLLWESHSIISSPSEIPEYERKPLENSVASSIRSPACEAGKDTTWTVFTYQRLGGILNRFKFVFGADGRLIDVRREIIARGVGDAHYLM